MKKYTVCVDLGKKRDAFSMLVLQANPKVVDGSALLDNPTRTVMYYAIVYLEQHKGMRYPDQIKRILHVVNYADIKNDYDLLVDGTGIGDPVVDYIRDAGLFPIPIIFTNGNSVNEVYEDIGNVFANMTDHLRAAKTLKEIRVPRDDLVSSGQILMQQGRLRVAQGIDHREEFEKQMMGFTGTVNKTTGRIKYEAEDEETHDDIVVCYLMGAWWVLNSTTIEGLKERVIPMNNQDEDYDPAKFY